VSGKRFRIHSYRISTTALNDIFLKDAGAGTPNVSNTIYFGTRDTFSEEAASGRWLFETINANAALNLDFNATATVSVQVRYTEV
jgi:hypothetical protein